MYTLPSSHSHRIPSLTILIIALLVLSGSPGMTQQVGPLVITAYTVDDDTAGSSGGDSDGIADAGELIELIVTLQNTGALTARSVHGSLSSTDSNIEVLDGEEDFADIPPGGTGATEFDFDFRVHQTIPFNHVVKFRLDITANSGGPWTDFIDISMHPLGPVELAGYIIDDDSLGESRGNGNGEANAGEQIELTVSVRNQGTSSIHALQATLTTSDPLTILTTDDAFFDSLASGDSAALNFDFIVDAGAPDGHRVKFDLFIHAGIGADWHSRFSIGIMQSGTQTAVNENRNRGAPATYNLEQNYPNPFKATTLLPVAIPAPSQVEISIYNLRGKAVRVIRRGLLQAGRYHFTWDGRNERGILMPTGVYWVRLRSDQDEVSRRIVLLR